MYASIPIKSIYNNAIEQLAVIFFKLILLQVVYLYSALHITK